MQFLKLLTIKTPRRKYRFFFDNALSYRFVIQEDIGRKKLGVSRKFKTFLSSNALLNIYNNVFLISMNVVLIVQVQKNVANIEILILKKKSSTDNFK